MSLPKEQAGADPVVDPVPHRAGQTTPQVDAELAPRLPNERDESADSQQGAPREVMKQAHDDLANGLVDTDRGPVVDRVYEDHVRPPDERTRDRGAPAEGGEAPPKRD